MKVRQGCIFVITRRQLIGQEGRRDDALSGREA